MTYSTSNTYTLKREILTFSNKISRHLSKPDIKFTADMTYGMLASGSCLLTDIVDQLHEDSKKVNSVSCNRGMCPDRQWSAEPPSLVKPPLLSTEAMMITRCS